MGKLLDDAKKSVHNLNLIFFWAILFVIALLLIMIIVSVFQLIFGNINVYSFVAINLILIWLGLLIGYLAWAIYFYNINLGLTNESWAELKEQSKSDAESMVAEQKLNQKYAGPEDNIYKEQSLGLPPGTIRGTLALTLMIGGLSLFIYSMGSPKLQEGNSFIYDNFEFFKTAFLMMIAFYFGSKSLEYLRKDAPGGVILKRFNNQTPQTENTQPTTDTFTSTTTSTTTTTPNTQPVTQTTQTASSAPAKSKVTSPSVMEKKEPTATLIAQGDNFVIEHKTLDNEDIEESCKVLNIEPAAMHAVVQVESGDSGFFENGQVKILFEGHVFWKHLADRKAKGLIPNGPEYYAATYQDIVYKDWTRQFYLIDEKEYLRLDKAILIDRDSAYMATSWGKFQILGENFEAAGFKGKTISDFVEAQKISEKEHLKAFVNFITNTIFKGKNLVNYLQSKDWSSFARAYNGPKYAENKYDINLEQAYHDFAISMNTKIKATLTRKESDDKQTLGELEVTDSDVKIFNCKTLELPWLKNQRNISCIPTGTYTVIKRTSEKYGTHFQLLNVPDRSMILIHCGNYYTHTQGCILVGSDFQDINQDGKRDVIESKNTLIKLYALMPDKFELKIC